MNLIYLPTATRVERTQLTSGDLIQIASRFAVPRAPWEALPYHEQMLVRIRAAGQSAREAVLVSKSAARIHGLWVVASAQECVELALPSRRCPARAQWPAKTVYRKLRLEPEDFREVEGVRVTSRARSCIDIARYHGFADGLVAMDSLLRQGYEVRHIEWALAAVGKVKNIAVARRCLASATAVSESPYESYARALFLEGLPDITVQPQVAVVPGIRVDLLVGGRVVIEIDGDVKYDGTTYRGAEETIVAERAREKKIQNAGFQVLRYSPAELRREPEQMLADVRRLVGTAAA